MPDSSVFITIKGSKGEYQDLSAPYMDLAVGITTTEDPFIVKQGSIKLEDLYPGVSAKTLPAKDLIGSVKPDVPTGYMDLPVGVASTEDLLVVELGID